MSKTYAFNTVEYRFIWKLSLSISSLREKYSNVMANPYLFGSGRKGRSAKPYVHGYRILRESKAELNNE